MESVLDLESGSFSEFALAAGGFAENILAVVARHKNLGMTEQNSSLIATTTFHIHEVGVRSRGQSLELVLLLFSLEGGMKEVSVHVFCWEYRNIL